MTSPDEDEAWLLVHARRAFTPQQRQADRVHAAVLTSVALPSLTLAEPSVMGSNGATAVGGSTAASATQTLGVWGGKAWLVGAALAVGAASGSVGTWAVMSSDRGSRPAAVATGDEGPARTRPEVSLPEPAATPPPVLPAQGDAPLPAAPVAEHAQTATLERNAPSSAPSGSGAPALALRAELASVREAERAVNSGEPARALEVLEELRRLPGGSLYEEREALGVLAHCQLGTPTWRDRARGFLSTYARSIYAPRIRAACGE